MPSVPSFPIRNPLYLQVKDSLLSRIQQSEWKPGEQIPTEGELSKFYGVSIGTIRRAVEILVDNGTLEKKEGKGTFLRTFRSGGYWNAFQIYKNMNGERRGSHWKLVIFECVKADDFLRKKLQLNKGDKVIHFVRQWVQITNGLEECVSLDESYVPEKRFRNFTAQTLKTKLLPNESLYCFYDREFNVVVLNQKCTAHFEIIPENEAKLLNVPPSFQVIRTDRISMTFGHNPIEYRINRGSVLVTKLFFDLSNT